MRLALRIIGFALLAVVMIVALGAGGIYLNAQRRLGERFDNPVPDVKVAGTPEQVERGKYLVSAFPGCAGCHSRNASANPPILDGNYIADLKPLGDFYAPNLTPGGDLKNWSDGEIVRAIREGVDKSGRGLLVMPSPEYRQLSDDDVQSVVAYLRSQPAVQHDQPAVSLGLLGTVLTGTGQLSTSHQPPATSRQRGHDAPRPDRGVRQVHRPDERLHHVPRRQSGRSEYPPRSAAGPEPAHRQELDAGPVRQDAARRGRPLEPPARRNDAVAPVRARLGG